MEDLRRVKSEIESLLNLYTKCIVKVKAVFPSLNGDTNLQYRCQERALEDDLSTLTKTILSDIKKTREKLNSKVTTLFSEIETFNPSLPKVTDLSEFKVVEGLDSSFETTFIVLNDNLQLWKKSPSTSLLESQEEPLVEWPTLQSIYGTSNQSKNLQTIIFQYEKKNSDFIEEDDSFLEVDYDMLELTKEEIDQYFLEVTKMVLDFFPSLEEKQVLLGSAVKGYCERNKDDAKIGNVVQEKFGKLRALVNILKHFSSVKQ